MLTSLLIKLRNTRIVRNNLRFFRAIFFLFQNIVIKKELKKNRPLKDLYQGKCCFIFGNGRSLKEVDFQKFSDEFTFGCNEIYLKEKFRDLKISFYAMVDTLFNILRKKVDYEDPKHFLPIIERGCSSEETLFFFDISLRRLNRNNRYLQNRRVHYVASNGINGPGKLRNINLDKRSDFTLGSLYFMIAASIYMGFKELYLMGMGYTFEPTQYCHFWDDPKEFERAKSFRSTPIDPRHYDIKRIAKENGVSIYNVVPEGYTSPVYDAISLAKVYELITTQKSDNYRRVLTA